MLQDVTDRCACGVSRAHYEWLKLHLARQTLRAEAAGSRILDLQLEKQQLMDRVHQLEVNTQSTASTLQPGCAEHTGLTVELSKAAAT